MSAKVFFAESMPADMVQLIGELEPRLELMYEPDILPAQRWVGDHFMGLSDTTSDPAKLARYRELGDQADIWFGLGSVEEFVRGVRANPGLTWVQALMAGAGQQFRKANLTDDELSRVTLTTMAGVHVVPLAEWSVLGVMMGLKKVGLLNRWKAERTWGEALLTKTMSQITVCVVGLGNIGRECVRHFARAGSRVIGVNRSQREVEGLAECYPTDRLVEAASQADALVVTLPAAVGTDKMVDEPVIRALPQGAIFVNVGRGSAVDEDALIAALADQHLSFAALDVFATEPLPTSSPLWEMDNVLIAPHSAARNQAEDRLIAELFADNATRFLDGREMRNVVDTVNWY